MSAFFLPSLTHSTKRSNPMLTSSPNNAMKQQKEQRGALDVLIETARQRPELMSLLPTFYIYSDGREWDEDAIPVDLTSLHGFRGFERSIE